jgi:hypothetical protein
MPPVNWIAYWGDPLTNRARLWQLGELETMIDGAGFSETPLLTVPH